jgi:hypothetical protein
MVKSTLPPLCRVSRAHLHDYINAPRSWPGDAEIYFECAGTQDQRDEAFAALDDAAAAWQGIEALKISREYQSYSEAALVIPARLFGCYGDLASFFAGLAAGAGLRAKTLAMANTETAPHNFPWFSWSAKTTLANQLADIATTQAAWARRLDHYIALDVAAGSCAHPDLVRELHLGLPPLEHMVTRALLEFRSTIRASVRLGLHNADGFNFGLVPAAQLRAAVEGLVAAGWVANAQWQSSGSGYFIVGRGPLARKLSVHDLLRLGL